MYSSYSSLQQSQLAAQGYYDTQSTYLLVYAPARCAPPLPTSSTATSGWRIPLAPP